MRAAFTLVELLVVVAIIAILIGLVLPVIDRARQMADSQGCASNMRQLTQGFLAFAADHRGRLPGGYWDAGNPDPTLRSWLTNRGQFWTAAPQCGTVFKYVKEPNIYRCPGLEFNSPNSGKGSNGKFDYSAIPGFAGASVAKVPTQAEFRHRDGRIDRTVFCPIVIEEDPGADINNRFLDGVHCNGDRTSPTHLNGGYYGCIDGSVHWIRYDPGSDARSWYTKSPSGRWVALGIEGQDYLSGWWDAQ